MTRTASSHRFCLLLAPLLMAMQGCVVAMEEEESGAVTRSDASTKKRKDASVPDAKATDSDDDDDEMPDASSPIDAARVDAAPVNLVPQQVTVPSGDFRPSALIVDNSPMICNLRTIGYGFTADGLGLGTRKSAQRCLYSTEVGKYLLLAVPDTGTCAGDSGGPLMIDGTNKLLGVLSGTNKNACTANSYSFHGALEANRRFIDAAISALERLP